MFWCFCPGEREIRDVGELLQRELQGARGSTELVLAPVVGAAEQDISARLAAAHRVGDQCGRDIDHRAGHSRRHRFGSGAHQPLQPAQPPAAPAHRARVARQRRSAQGPLRPLGAGACACGCTAEADFEARAAFTEPEILRTNLAALLLRLAADGLGEAEDFPFIDPPDARALQRRLSAAAGAAGARCRSAHHAPRPGHGAPAARSALGAGVAREQAISRRKPNCWPSSRA